MEKDDQRLDSSREMYQDAREFKWKPVKEPSAKVLVEFQVWLFKLATYSKSPMLRYLAKRESLILKEIFDYIEIVKSNNTQTKSR